MEHFYVYSNNLQGILPLEYGDRMNMSAAYLEGNAF
jgi:hypothetical protein